LFSFFLFTVLSLPDFYPDALLFSTFSVTLSRACLKKAFRELRVPVCGRFYPNEGGVAGYGNRMRVKSPAKWGLQIAEMIFQTSSSDMSQLFFDLRSQKASCGISPAKINLCISVSSYSPVLSCFISVNFHIMQFFTFWKLNYFTNPPKIKHIFFYYSMHFYFFLL